MNKHAQKTEVAGVKLDYNALKVEAKDLGLPTTGKAAEIAARIEEFKAAQAKTETRGRKVDPNSARQLRLATQGTGQRGRKPDPTSAWNIKQKALAEKKAAGELKLGRPVNPTSARQERLAKVGTVKRGRPAKVIEEVIPTAPVEEVLQENIAEQVTA